MTDQTCVEIESSPGGFVGYDVGVCSNGECVIQKIDAAGNPANLREGIITTADAYVLGLQVDHNQYGISIDSQPYMTVTDTSYPGS